MGKTYSKEYFIQKSKERFKDKFDYSLVDYVNAITKVTIICPIHGKFETLPKLHMRSKYSCIKCAKEVFFKERRDADKKNFLDRANKKHKGKFDYSLVEYVNNSTDIKIICPEHGIFEIRPCVHIDSKFGCQKCAIKITFNKKREKENIKFIKAAKKAHKNKFDYSKINYINNSTPVVIICPEHGEFLQIPYIHLISKYGCQKCAKENNVVSFKKTIFSGLTSVEYYIKKSIEKHDTKYDYSLIKDKNIKRETKIPIKCENGHVFNQSFHDHISGNGCPYCAKLCTDTKSFIKLSKEKHGDKYDYSKTEYKIQKEKVVIICPKHGEFKQNPSNHYFLGRGCPCCKTSKGENEIKKFLKKNSINFTQQKSFLGCKNKNVLLFDFYIINHNMCIEYDGKQHFESIKRFGGDMTLKETEKHDNIKNEYCKLNGIRLIRIKYTENLEKVLQHIFNLT